MAEVEGNVTPEAPNPAFLVDDATKQFFEEYVGPGKKYANVGELAKGYANADKHLSEVTRDAGIFKTEADKLKELLMENITNNNNQPNSNEQPPVPPIETPPAPPPSSEAPPKNPVEDVDLKALVKEALSEQTIEERRRTNAEATEAATIKRFGSKEDAVKAIAAKAEELGLSEQWIANLAFESPKAYYATMGFQPDEQPRSSNTPAPRSDVNPAVLGTTNPQLKPNTYKYFDELRRTNPSKWRSLETQQAIMKAAQENPDFYS
jgi:hypothetical protein